MGANETELFSELNAELKKKNIHLSIICVGGFVLHHIGMRTTIDIDAFFESSEEIHSMIRAIGNKYQINTEDELWLNNSVMSLNEVPPEAICSVLYQFSNLIVLMPPIEYVAGMKLYSAREQDIEDAAYILRTRHISSPEQFRSLLESYGFQNIDESVLLEAFGVAYGMEWLSGYFREHEEEIHARILQH